MKRLWPLVLALMSCLLFAALILSREWQLKNSMPIFVQLQPVDPRSLLQGDYMQLNYNLEWELGVSEVNDAKQWNTKIANKHTILAYARLDQQNRVIATTLDHPNQSLEPVTKMGRLNGQIKSREGQAEWVLLKLKNPSNDVNTLYPSTSSFFFAEGLASCYERATYAEFRVDTQGNAILGDLVDDELNSLNCHAGKSWWGS